MFLRFAENTRYMNKGLPMMKRWLLLCLTVFCLWLLTGCSEPDGIVGIWEEEIQVSILGSEQQGEAAAVTRFIFREDGTGSWGTELLDGRHTEAVREFYYRQEEDKLILSYASDTADTEFAMTLSENTLRLESKRGSFSLKRIKN